MCLITVQRAEPLVWSIYDAGASEDAAAFPVRRISRACEAACRAQRGWFGAPEPLLIAMPAIHTLAELDAVFKT